MEPFKYIYGIDKNGDIYHLREINSLENWFIFLEKVSNTLEALRFTLFLFFSSFFVQTVTEINCLIWLHIVCCSSPYS